MTRQPLQDINCPRCQTKNVRSFRWCRRCRTPLGGSTDEPLDVLYPAQRWRRLVAWIIDLPLSPAAFVVGILSADMGGPAISTVALLVLAIVGVPYQVVLLRREGQTVGKLLLRIRIVDEETGVKGPIFKNIVLRYFVNWLLILIPPYVVIDHAFIFAKNRRCVHDYLAGTKVVLDSPRT
ncbi:MAG: RDD family protein [Dehalococcoidia bacterium]|nr:RDD family protein [Dehalococcoidia bacterium]